MEKINTSKGITLIILVITIIIMIILAGATISMFIDKNGMYETAEDTMKDWDARGKREEEVLEAYLDSAIEATNKTNSN